MKLHLNRYPRLQRPEPPHFLENIKKGPHFPTLQVPLNKDPVPIGAERVESENFLSECSPVESIQKIAKNRFERKFNGK